MVGGTLVTVVSCHNGHNHSTHLSGPAGIVQAACSNYKDMDSLFKRIIASIPYASYFHHKKMLACYFQNEGPNFFSVIPAYEHVDV